MRNTQSGIDLLTGPIGKIISWGWILGQLAMLFYGYLILRRGDGITKLIADSALSAVVISWLISIGTIGDHRFRIPTMGFSLLLQVVTIFALKKRLSKAL